MPSHSTLRAPRNASARTRWPGTFRYLAALIILAGLLLPALPRQATAAAVPGHAKLPTKARPAPQLSQSVLARFGLATLSQSANETELEDLSVLAIDADSTPDKVMRSRPFVLTDQSMDA